MGDRGGRLGMEKGIFGVHSNQPVGGLPYIGYIDMCSSKGYGVLAVLVINRVLILADFDHK